MPLPPKLLYELYNDDCLKVLPTLREPVQLVLADPPYGTTQCKWDSVIPLDLMWENLKRTIAPGAAVVITCAQPFTSRLGASNLDWLRYEWIWQKSPSGNLNARKQPMSAHENILVFSKTPTIYNPQDLQPTVRNRSEKDNSKTVVYGQQRRLAYVQTVTNYPTTILAVKRDAPNNPDQRRVHPTQKPIALMEYLIKTYSNEGDLILDFAMGSGTTGVACGNLNRRFIGIEIDKEYGYFKIAERRIKEAYKGRKYA